MKFLLKGRPNSSLLEDSLTWNAPVKLIHPADLILRKINATWVFT